MAVDSKGVSVRQHAQNVRDRLVAEGAIKPDSNARIGDEAIPPFSAGTATIDPNTGKVAGAIAPAPQAFSDSAKIDLPADKAVEKPTDGTPTAKPAAKATDEQQQAGDDAANTAAQTLLTEKPVEDEYGEFEFEDPDLSTTDAPVKYAIRVPKRYLESAKRGYGRRAALDRAMSYLHTADPVVRELVADGRMNRVVPILRFAMSSQGREFADWLWKGYQRAAQGLSPMESAAQEIATGRDATATMGEGSPAEDILSDPYYGPPIKELRDELAQLRSERQTEAQRQQQDAARRQEIGQTMAAAHYDVANMFPGSFHPERGPQDQRWEAAVAYARESGYIENYGLRGGIVLAAQALAQIEAERVAAAASPAAAAIDELEAQRSQIARGEAAATAALVANGTPGTPPAPTPYAPPARFRADGTLKPVDEFLQEAIALRHATAARRDA